MLTDTLDGSRLPRPGNYGAGDAARTRHGAQLVATQPCPAVTLAVHYLHPLERRHSVAREVASGAGGWGDDRACSGTWRVNGVRRGARSCHVLGFGCGASRSCWCGRRCGGRFRGVRCNRGCWPGRRVLSGSSGAGGSGLVARGRAGRVFEDCPVIRSFPVRLGEQVRRVKKAAPTRRRQGFRPYRP